MKTSIIKLNLSLILLVAAILFYLSCSDNSFNNIAKEKDLQLKVTFAPIEVITTNGKVNLMYSVEIANFEEERYKLKDFQVLNSADGNLLCSIQDTGKYMLIHKPLIDSIPPQAFYYPLGGHATYRFSIGLILDPAQVPQKIKHKLVLIKDSKENIIEGAETSISKKQITIISSPFKGDRYISANTTTLTNNQHPIYQFTYRGNTTVPERYCVDWNKIDVTGIPFHGDQSICENWYVYGQNVYAVADGQVISVNDGMKDQSPVGTVSADINTFNSGGNQVMIFIAGGYVIYGHLKPNSIAVKAGQEVVKGQLIGKVGNSGNSQAPHLHFGLHTEFPFYISEGLPYYIDSLEKIGSTGKPGGKFVKLQNPELHINELVENCGVYNFK